MTVATSLALGLGGGHSPAHAASDNTVVVFDASNSMNSRFEKSQRIREAKQALIDAARRTGVNPGLVVFGSRQVQSCGDVATLVPVNANNPAQMAAALAGIRAMGVSSLAAAMGAAAAEVSSQGQPAKMLVIADGAGVKSCRVDTCTFATELKSQNPNLSISVVAVSPKPQEVPSLRCISQATGGNYFEVRTTRGLRSAMVQALAAPLPAIAIARIM
ncbi:MAG: VWA domain-containing protein, partial [Hyphomicrobiales bacterium]